MKKESASRRKKLPLLLGALLIISVAAYGTRAYFSDSAKQQANIELELGDVEISTDKTKEWKYTPLETGINLDATEAKNKKLGKSKQDANVVYTNVRPGDSFTREYVIENTGSLDVKVGLEYSGQLVQSPLPIKLEGAEINVSNIKVEDTPFLISISGLQTNFTLKPKGTEKYTVTITVDEQANNDFNINNKKSADLDKFTSDFLEETLSIKAVQTNADNATLVD
ncbi:hypothetical protein [Carnobacterium sp. FSL W8-0810]|uniref:hypothetical protein n=1 Tax=Carnobacterium sp. FSL W8-0810 TaxID=2954705 RepID=UPI0030FCA285